MFFKGISFSGCTILFLAMTDISEANVFNIIGWILAFLSIKFDGAHQIGFWIASLAAFGLAFGLTFVFSKTKLNKGSVTGE